MNLSESDIDFVRTYMRVDDVAVSTSLLARAMNAPSRKVYHHLDRLRGIGAIVLEKKAGTTKRVFYPTAETMRLCGLPGKTAAAREDDYRNRAELFWKYTLHRLSRMKAGKPATAKQILDGAKARRINPNGDGYQGGYAVSMPKWGHSDPYEGMEDDDKAAAREFSQALSDFSKAEAMDATGDPSDE